MIQIKVNQYVNILAAHQNQNRTGGILTYFSYAKTIGERDYVSPSLHEPHKLNMYASWKGQRDRNLMNEKNHSWC